VTISINQISRGTALRIDNGIFVVQECNHVKPGKGSAFVRIKIKNVNTQLVLEKTYKTADKLDDVELEERKMQNLYKSGDSYHFMDNESYEEVQISKEVLGDNIKFLQENADVLAYVLDGRVLRVEVAMFIEAEISHTEPGFRGDTSRAGNKPATIETGAVIQVPLFVEIGDKVKIDTRTGTYVERVKK
jgi:elongation factor P